MRRILVLTLVMLITVLGIVTVTGRYSIEKATAASVTLAISTPGNVNCPTPTSGNTKTPTPTLGIASMTISSPAFGNCQMIPKIYTCDGQNINPPLLFSNIPQNAKSLALIVDDPDAPTGTWVHWIIFNMLPTTTKIAPISVPTGSTLGTTSFGEPGYGGPCPPSGTHRYFFKLYALNTKFKADTQTTKDKLEKEMQGHVLDQAEIVGLYRRA
jgi:Raf kinase inhibitor-like YbhB/YbcL family protein